MKKLIAVGMLLALMVAPVQAGQSAQALVEETSNLMLAKLKEEQAVLKEEPSRLYELVNDIVLPHFDFEYMSQMVLAKHWRRAKPDEKVAFTAEFKMLLVRTYATSLKEYTDQELIYLPFRSGRDASQALVRTEIEQPGGFPIPIDYKLRDKGQGWKVFDVIIDGVSMVTNYRSSFAKEIRKSGLDSLIQTLAKRNKKAQSS